jgi:hypothetical protein
MSDFPADTLKKWREQGSLRYLTHHLRVTIKGTAKAVTFKQVTRYWDKGWIDGAYPTPKGHRRIRYTDDTVERVAAMVRGAKATNIAIRYRTPTGEINYCGTIIPVKGCTKMEDVYKRARKAGLNKRDATNAAYAPIVRRAPSMTDIVWEYLHALEGTSEKEVAERMNLLSEVPASYLYQARDAEEFRARSRASRERFLSRLEARAGWDGFPRSSAEGEARRQKIRDLLLPLFDHQDRESFLAAYNLATELDRRVLVMDEVLERIMKTKEIAEMDESEKSEYRAQTYRKLQANAAAKPEALLLEIAAVSLKRSEQAPSAAALALALGVSRRALYRTYGKTGIKAALNLVRNDTTATHTSRTDRKKSNQNRV